MTHIHLSWCNVTKDRALVGMHILVYLYIFWHVFISQWAKEGIMSTINQDQLN